MCEGTSSSLHLLFVFSMAFLHRLSKAIDLNMERMPKVRSMFNVFKFSSQNKNCKEVDVSFSI